MLRRVPLLAVCLTLIGFESIAGKAFAAEASRPNVVFLLILTAGAGFFALNVQRLVRYLRVGLPEDRTDAPAVRVKNVLSIGIAWFFHRRRRSLRRCSASECRRSASHREDLRPPKRSGRSGHRSDRSGRRTGYRFGRRSDRHSGRPTSRAAWKSSA